MRYRNLYILIGIIILLLVVVLVYTGIEKGGTKSPFSAVDIKGIRIKRPTDTTEFTLIDGKWMLSKPLSYPADSSLMERLIADLDNLKIGEVISEREEKFGDFGVGDGGMKITLLYPKREVSFFIGGYAGDYEHSYLRFEGDNKVYLSRGLSKYTLDKKPDNWRDKSILSFDKENLKEIEIDGKRITRRDTVWVLDGVKIETKKISPVINMLSNLSADGFADTLSFQSRWKILLVLAEETIELKVGKKLDHRYPVRRDDFPTTFLVGEGQIERLRELI